MEPICEKSPTARKRLSDWSVLSTAVVKYRNYSPASAVAWPSQHSAPSEICMASTQGLPVSQKEHGYASWAERIYKRAVPFLSQIWGTKEQQLQVASLSSKLIAWQLRKETANNQFLLLLGQIRSWDIAGPACHQENGTTATTTVLHRKGKESHFPLLISICICLLFKDPAATFHGSIAKSLVHRESKAKVWCGSILTCPVERTCRK